MAERRRILVVGLYYAPESTGSAPYTTGMAQHFAAQGHDVTIVTGVPHYPQWRADPRYRRPLVVERIEGVTVVRVRNFVPRTQTAATRALYELSWFVPSLPQVLRQRFDVVLAMSPPLAALPLARAAARRSGAPWGVVLQDLMGKGAAQAGTAGGARVAALVDRVETAHLRAAHRVGVIGSGFRDAVVAMGVDPAHIDVLPNWTHVETAVIGRSEARQRLGWPVDDFLVVHTGNMGNKQGLDNVVAAAAEADRVSAPVTFVLVGDGNQRAALVSMARGVRRLRFVPPTSDADYPSVLAAADVLLVNERPGMLEMSLPSKVTSYLAAGRPILAAVPPGGGTARLLEATGAARVTSAGIPSDLVEAALELARDDAGRKAMATRAVAFAAENLSAASALARYDDFLGCLLTASS